MVRWLREQGLEAGAFETQYGDDTVEADAAGADETAATGNIELPFDQSGEQDESADNAATLADPVNPASSA
jgi:putative mRNA 3-end processing factor